RGIALQYVFLFIPVGLVVLAKKRSLKPVARGLAILLIAVASGFPAHLAAGNWFLRPGGLSSQSLDISGGWNLDYFQPTGVMLGLQSFPIAVDDENGGPLADFGFPSATAADTLAWILLAAALFGLVRASRQRPIVLAIAVGTALSLGFNRIVLNYPYGWVKLMPISAPLVYALAVGSASDFVRLARGLWGRWAVRLVVVAVAALFSATCLLLAFSSYEAIWSNGAGWGQSVPSSLPMSLRDLRQVIPPGSKLFVSGHFDYPVPEDRLHVRQHMLGMRSDAEERLFWGRRVRSIAMSELLPVNSYAWLNDALIFSQYRRLLDDESYDYYLLAAGNDPRLEGLDSGDAVWSDSGLSLYSAKGVVRKSPWLIMKERGSLAVSDQNPLLLSASQTEIRTVEGALASTEKGVGRIRLGILSFSQSEVVVSSPGFSKKLVVDAGLTWYSTPGLALPSSLTVTSQQPVGLVSVRLLGDGKEETEFTPRRFLGYFLYASSTLLNPDEWLTDPFRGAKPGSA
ncbi:MAG TPA: hypothetical protein VF960_09160, partial [Chloroflexota bacterium]